MDFADFVLNRGGRHSWPSFRHDAQNTGSRALYVRPEATLDALPVLSPGDSHTFEVTYTVDEELLLDMDTFVDNHEAVRVTSFRFGLDPFFYQQHATLESWEGDLSQDSQIVATYEIEAPSGGWQTEHNGTFTVWMEADAVYDTSGLSVPSGSLGAFSVHVNTVPPVSWHELDGEEGNDDWFLSPVELTLDAEDELGQVEQIEYQIVPLQWPGDLPDAWRLYRDPLLIEDDGRTEIAYRATDDAGNVEEPNFVTIRIDTITPTTSVDLDGDLGQAGWFAGPVEVALSAGPSRQPSLIDRIEYRLDESGPWEIYEEPFTVDAEGVTELQTRAYDRAGNVESPQTTEVRIDTIAPVSDVDLSGDAGNDPWFLSPVSVELWAEDEGSGVDRIEYRLDDTEPWQTYDDTFTLDAEGVTTLDYRAVDTAGNVESFQSAGVHIDTIAPVSNLTLDGVTGNDPWFLSPVKIALSATDATSGIDRIEYRLDDTEPWQTYNDTFTLDAEGVTTLDYRAVDTAGSVESFQSADVHIDTVAPVSNLTLNGVTGNNPWFLSPAEVALSATDATSGVDRIEYRLDDADDWTLYDEMFIVDAQNVTELQHRAIDQAGNIETAQSASIHIDTIAPEAALLAEDVTEYDSAGHQFSVVYTDNLAMDASTIASNSEAIRVIAPDGSELSTTFVNLDDSDDGTPHTATYEVAAPGGGWWAEDMGDYVVHVVEEQVADVAGNFVADGALGSFSVNVGLEADFTGDTRTLTFTDSTGAAVRVTLSGGQAELVLGGTKLTLEAGDDKLTVTGGPAVLEQIAFTDTTLGDELAITVEGGDGRADLGTLLGDTPLGRLAAGDVDLVGEGILLTDDGVIERIELGGIHDGASIVLPGELNDEMTLTAEVVGDDVELTTASALRSLTAIAWGGGVIEAASLDRLDITGDAAGNRGDFGADLTLTDDETATSLQVARIAGAIVDATWQTASSIGRIDAAALLSSNILVGAEGVPNHRDQLTPGASLQSIVLRGFDSDDGPSFADSNVAAWQITRADLGDVATDNDGTTFGLATTQIRQLAYTPAGESRPVRLNPSHWNGEPYLDDDFMVRIL